MKNLCQQHFKSRLRDCLLNAAARLLSGTKKFDRGLSQLMHVDLHWLHVPERVKYKLATMVYNCLNGKAPSYLTDCCTPISDVVSRRHLHSASRRQLLIPRHNLSTYGRRAFSVMGSATWNCMCDELREPLLTAKSFRQLLKTRQFAEYQCIQRIRGITHYALYKSTYLLTYLLLKL